jgi:hypothetical protein
MRKNGERPQAAVLMHMGTVSLPARVPLVSAGVSYIVIVFGYCPEVRASAARVRQEWRSAVVE